MAMWRVGFCTGSPAVAAPRKVLNKAMDHSWHNGFASVLGKAPDPNGYLRWTRVGRMWFRRSWCETGNRCGPLSAGLSALQESCDY